MPPEHAIRILAVDTSSQRGSVALLEGRDLAAELRLNSLETHSARLLTSVQFLLQSAGWALADVELVAAGIGPGSFTGIRIGVATALGLAQSLAVPFAGVSGLDSVALSVSMVEGRVGVAMDAQRGQLYYAEYSSDGHRFRIVRRPGLWNPLDLAGTLQDGRLYLAGDGATRYARELRASPRGWPRLVQPDLYLAPSIGRLALVRRRTWKSGESLRSEPLYIRPPDAQRPRARKS